MFVQRLLSENTKKTITIQKIKYILLINKTHIFLCLSYCFAMYYGDHKRLNLKIFLYDEHFMRYQDFGWE